VRRSLWFVHWFSQPFGQ